MKMQTGTRSPQTSPSRKFPGAFHEGAWDVKGGRGVDPFTSIVFFQHGSSVLSKVSDGL